MQLFALKLPLIRRNDPLLEIVVECLKKQENELKNGDIIVISEKVVATSQGRVVNLNDVENISERAQKLAKKHDMDDRFVELILREATNILGGMQHVILAEVNDFLIANAGIDQSNAGADNVVLLPSNPKDVAWDYWMKLKTIFEIEDLGIIIADSRVQPLRVGTIGIAVATAGFEPIQDCIGKQDLFDRPLEITKRAVADDLASAAQFLLGEAAEQTPVVVIREAGVEFTDTPQTITRMPPEQCLYMNIFSKYLLKKKK